MFCSSSVCFRLERWSPHDICKSLLCLFLSISSILVQMFCSSSEYLQNSRKESSSITMYHIVFSWTGYISSLQIHWKMKPLAVHQSTHIFSLFVFYIKLGPFVTLLYNCKQGKAHKGRGRQHVVQPVGPHPWYLATQSFKLLRKQNKYRKREKCISEILNSLKRNQLHYVPKPVFSVKMNPGTMSPVV